jgi:hypothetical protein
MGSAGRWPAVFGVPPNTSGNTDWKNQKVFLATQPDGRRRVGDDSTRAACSPRSTASFRLRRNAMKRMFIVLLSAVAAATFCSGNVPGVTVYADRARVTRMAAPADALHEQIRDLKAKF